MYSNQKLKLNTIFKICKYQKEINGIKIKIYILKTNCTKF